jgi:FkbM family methyltransferase
MGTISRCARWFLASRIVEGPLAVPFVSNAKLLVSRGMRGATENVHTGLSEFVDMSFLLHLLRPKDLFVDVGANVGAYTVLASAVVGASTLALEPVPSTFMSLRHNLAINGIDALVDAKNIAAGDAEGVVPFTSALGTVNHVATETERSSDVIEVPVETLDALLAGKAPTLMKIDVEGFEENVLVGASNTLQSLSLLGVIIETNESGQRYGKSDVALHQNLVSHGFERISYDPFTRTISAEKEAGRNSLYIKHQAVVEERLRGASPFSVNGRFV